MPTLSAESEKIIKEFLQVWWEDLTWKVRETLLGTEIPYATADTLYDSGFGLTLRQMAAAAEGLSKPTADERMEVQDCVQHICEWMFARPGMPGTYTIPQEFWLTPLGWLTLRAHIWARQDALITPSQAQRMSGKSLPQLRQMSDRHRLAAYADPTEKNPQRQTRFLKSEIKALARRSKTTKAKQ